MGKYTTQEKNSKNQYVKEFLPAIIIYMVLIIASQYALQEMGDNIWKYPVALSPMVPIFFVFRAVIRFIQRSDEFIRKLHGESAVITLVIVNFVGFAYGLMIYAGAPTVDLFTSASMICPLYFLVYYFLNRKHGGSGCY